MFSRVLGPAKRLLVGRVLVAALLMTTLQGPFQSAAAQSAPLSSQVAVNATDTRTFAASAPPPPVVLLDQPQRLVDTRSTVGGPIASGSPRCFPVAGQGTIPADAIGVILNVTGVGYTGDGWLTLYPAGQAVPGTSTLNFDNHEYAIANGAIGRLGTNG